MYIFPGAIFLQMTAQGNFCVLYSIIRLLSGLSYISLLFYYVTKKYFPVHIR